MIDSRIAVRVPNHLGDCVMSLPLIRTLVSVYGEVGVVTPLMYASIYERVEGVNCIPFENEARHGLLGAFSVARSLRQHGIEQIFLLPTSFSSAASAMLAGIPHRIGYPTDGRGILLSEMRQLPSVETYLHRSEQYLRLYALQDRQSSDHTLRQLSELAQLKMSEIERSSIRSRLSNIGIAPDQKFVVLPFRAVAESRRWGKENYAQLGKWLANEFGFQIILVGTTADQPEGEWLQNEIGDRSINLAGSTTLAELMALMAEASLVIGNDSGPCHVAAAVGAPLIVLSGADDPRETSPLSNNKIVVRAESVECLGCVKNRCPKKGTAFMRCMHELSIADVRSTVEKMLS